MSYWITTVLFYLALGFLAAILMGLLWGWRYAPDRYSASPVWQMAAIMLFWPAFIAGSIVVILFLFLAFVSEAILNKIGKKN